MLEIICPSCGTTYPKFEPGICECCGFEFTEEYLNPIIEKAKREEDEEKKRRLAQEKIEALKRKQRERERIEAEKVKSRRQAEELKSHKQMIKDREKREKLRDYIGRQKEIVERDKRFSLKFKSFRNIFSKIGTILSILLICFCVFTLIKVGGSATTPFDIINSKVEYLKNSQTIMLSEEGKNKQNKVTYKVEQSIDVILNNQSSFEEKASFIHIDKLTNLLTNDSSTNSEKIKENEKDV